MNYEHKFWVCIAISNLWAMNGSNYVAMLWVACAVVFMVLSNRFDR